MEDRPASSETVDALRFAVPLMAALTVVGAVSSAPGTPAENVVAAVAAVPFAVWAFGWRRMPTLLLMALTCGAAAVAQRSGELEPLMFLLCVATTVVGGWETSTRAVVAGGALAVATPVVVEYLHDDGVLFGVWVMGVTLSLLLPRAFRWQVSLVTQLAEAREELTRQAVLEEKRAIARDVHDLVGHGLAAVLLHVTGARHVLRRDPDTADEALAEAVAVGRRSLQELRRTIGVLRSTDAPVVTAGRGLTPDQAVAAVRASTRAGGDGAGGDGTGGGAGRGRATRAGGDGTGAGPGRGRGPGSAPVRPPLGEGPMDPPVPGVGDLPDVVASARASGLDVTLRSEGDLGRVDPIVGLSLHRVAEAALANARQHAPAAVTDVVIRVGADEVVMTVESLGPLRGPDPADADRPRYGLVGMRERMTAVGGQLEAAPTATGWLVRAQVPVEEERA